MTVFETVAGAIERSLFEASSMFWATLWALVLVFALSGAVQAFVSRGRMQQLLGDHRPDHSWAKPGWWAPSNPAPSPRCVCCALASAPSTTGDDGAWP